MPWGIEGKVTAATALACIRPISWSPFGAKEEETGKVVRQSTIIKNMVIKLTQK